MTRAYIVIPARLASTRLPRKLLLRETGKPLIQHTYEAACRAEGVAGVCIAADSDEIAAEVVRFGADVEITDPLLPSGTDRVAEIARRHPDYDIFVNVQGDEPELDPLAIERVVAMLAGDAELNMTTAAAPIRTRDALDDPACVKVVCDARGRAMYFSRAAMPHARDWDDSLLEAEPPHFLQHLGLYAYRRDFLLRLTTLPPCRLEVLERLEQLRVLDAGWPIGVAVVPHANRGIDTPADYAAFVARFRAARRAE